MPNSSVLTLAVAGSRKTQGIVQDCAGSNPAARILILTYTRNNQGELTGRLAKYAGDHYGIEVLGWFSFLIRYFVKPYLPMKFPGRRVRGFDFHTIPNFYFKADNPDRFISRKGHVYRVHLPQLACLVNQASAGGALNRLSRMYDVIYIDEVQDLCGYDLEILKLLAGCGVPIKMVGDVRQAVIATNPQEQKNKKYRFMGIWSWFQEEEKAGRIQIVQRCETWRCRPEIASFADSLFSTRWGFNASNSLNQRATSHDGLFLIRIADLPKYMETFHPMLLRHSANSGKTLPYSFVNYKESKGLSVKRVCILPTEPIRKYLSMNGALGDQQSAELYVAVTRAEQSVAFILDDAGACKIPYWTPVL